MSLTSHQPRVIAGAMSGTSADGVDVALVQITGQGTNLSATLLRHHTRPYEPAVRQAIFSVRQDGTTNLSTLAKLGRDISLAYAAAVNEALLGSGLSADQLACVAAHGQTLFHEPPLTIQWFDPSLVASEVGCPVVSDFRRADCAAGGQGAPLVPFADLILFGDSRKNRVLLNLGGIANLTYLRAGGTSTEMIAFDTGPGNCLSDALSRLIDPTGPGVDVDGKFAAVGTPILPLVYTFLRHDYFSQDPPKTTDVPTMQAIWSQACESLGDKLKKASASDLLASACLISAKAVAEAVRDFVPKGVDEVISSGGGVRNSTLMRHLRAELGDIPVRTSDEFGVPSEAKEAIAFALLGAATLDGTPGNVPSATGAHRAVVLGSITPRP